MGPSIAETSVRTSHGKATSARSSGTSSSASHVDSQPSYSTDSAAMQHSTFRLQAKASNSAQQEATSPPTAKVAPPSSMAANAMNISQPLSERPAGAAPDSKLAQQMPTDSNNQEEEHEHAEATVSNQPAASGAATTGEAAVEDQSAAAAQPQIRFEEMELIEQVAVPELVQVAEDAKIGWGRVKGYPSWPAHIMSDKAAQPRLSHARRSSSKALPVMFFGTLEVAWLAEKDMCNWRQGLQDHLWDKGKKREAFVLAVQQVCDFVHVHAPRSAPQDWWCKPPALPAPARRQAKAATTNNVQHKHPTSAGGQRLQTQQQPATAIKPKTAAKLRVDASSTPATRPMAADLLDAQRASAPAALKQGSKRKYTASSGKRAKAKAAVPTPPAVDQAAVGSPVAEPISGALADLAPVPEPAGVSEALLAPLAAAQAGPSSLPSIADAAATSASVVPALLPDHSAPGAKDAIAPNKRAKTAASKTASGQDTKSISAFTTRALSDLMEDAPLLEALQELLASIGAALPAKPNRHQAMTADLSTNGNMSQPTPADHRPPVGSNPAEAPSKVLDTDHISKVVSSSMLLPEGDSAGATADSATGAKELLREAVSRASCTIEVPSPLPTPLVPAVSAVPSVAAAASATTSTAATPLAELSAAATTLAESSAAARVVPAAAAPPPAVPPVPAANVVLAATVPAVLSAGASAGAGRLASAEGGGVATARLETAAEQTGTAKNSSKRLRGKAAVLAKVLGLSRARAVKQHLKAAQQCTASGHAQGLQVVACPALQAALAHLGMTCQQLMHIDSHLVKEVLDLNARHMSVAAKDLSAEALQGLQDVKAALQAASVQRHQPLQAAAIQQAPPTQPPTALPSQPASQANIPQQLASSQSNYLRDRAPSYVHIPRNVYARGLSRPKRQPKDDIPICICTLHQASGLLGALPARQPTQRQANSNHNRLLAQQAASGRVVLSNATDQSSSAAQELHTAQQGLTGGGSGAAESPADAVAAKFELPQACGEECLNRLSYIRCDAKLCPCGVACSNRPFHELQSPQVEVFLTANRGWGVKAAQPIKKGTFVVEYAGEVITHVECERRMQLAKEKGEPHFYMMELGPGLIIDARDKGNVARLINSSCAPNCESQKWHDAASGETRVGIFALADIPHGEELSYDYQFQHSGLMQAAGAYRCMCGAATCRGTMDSQPERLKDFGKRIEVWWEGDNVFYRGTIVGYSTNARKHTVLYDDNETEKVSLDTTPHRWLDENASPHPSPLRPVPDAQGNWQPPPPPVTQDAIGKVRGSRRLAGKSAIKKQTRKRKRSVAGIRTLPPAKAVPVAMPVASAALRRHEPHASNASESGELLPHQASAINAAAAGPSEDRKFSPQLLAAQPPPILQATPAVPSTSQEQHPHSGLALGITDGPTAEVEQPAYRTEVSVSADSSKRGAEDCPITAVNTDADVSMTVVKPDSDVNMTAVKPDADVNMAVAGGADAHSGQGMDADSVPSPGHKTLACNQLIAASAAPAPVVKSNPDATEATKAASPAVSAQVGVDDAQMQSAVPAMAKAMTATRPADTDQHRKPDHNAACPVTHALSCAPTACNTWEIHSPGLQPKQKASAATEVHAATEQPQLPQPDADIAAMSTEVLGNEEQQLKSSATAVVMHNVLDALHFKTKQDCNDLVIDKVQQARLNGRAVIAATPLDLIQHSVQGDSLPKAARYSVKHPEASPGAYVEAQPGPAGAPSFAQANTTAQQQHGQESVGHLEPQMRQGNVIVADRSAFTGLVDYADSDSD